MLVTGGHFLFKLTHCEEKKSLTFAFHFRASRYVATPVFGVR